MLAYKKIGLVKIKLSNMYIFNNYFDNICKRRTISRIIREYFKVEFKANFRY